MPVVRRSDIIEEEGVHGATRLIIALFVLIVSLVLLYLGNAVGRDAPENSVRSVYLSPLLILVAVVGIIVGLVIGVLAANRMLRTRKMPAVTVECPYCGGEVRFPTMPTQDWDCEHCHRQVRYENGVQVPLKAVACTFCGTEHKVAATTTHYLCDSCNRPLRLVDPNNPTAVVSDVTSDILRNYDVLLTQVGRRPTDVAMALESILICNLREARQRMEELPLVVMRNVPERKADAVRRRLRDLGAVAVMRPTDQPEDAPIGKRG